MPEYYCPECGLRVTRGPSGVEYGHARGFQREKSRCSRRPESVDPVDQRTNVVTPHGGTA